uniref:Uncharacterized protein n=1 Tax=Sinocyclocheilus anshuiensis TaxID=1608454 RepID=A0A671MJT5_9TELE
MMAAVKELSTCRDPDEPKSEVLRKLAKKHPSVITIIRLDDPCSVKESGKKVGSLLGNNGLNLLVNNAAIVANGSIQTNREYLPYLQTAAKASGTPGMSCNKAAVINISTVAGSMIRMPPLHTQFPVLPYAISKAGCNMLTVLAAEELKAPLEPKESVEGMLHVIGSLTEKQHGGLFDYTGETISW